MQYDEFYTSLGKLFYLVASADGRVDPAERQRLTDLIKNRWAPLEDSTDLYGTDKAHFIDFAFEFAEEEGDSEQFLADFESFYKDNRESITAEISKKIIETCQAIAAAYRGSGPEERELLSQIKTILKQ